MSDMKENLELLSRSLYRLPVAELTDEQLHAVVVRAVLARLQPAWQGSLPLCRAAGVLFFCGISVGQGGVQ